MQPHRNIGFVSGWGYDAHCWPKPPASWQNSIHFFPWHDFIAIGDDELKARFEHIDYWGGLVAGWFSAA